MAAPIHKPRVKEVASNKPNGATAFNLPASAPTGFQTFAAAYDSTQTLPYHATNGTDWEDGIGTFTDAATDTLDRVLIASSTGSLIDWSAGGDVTVSVQWSAYNGNRFESVALTRVASSPTTANVTAEIGILHALNISGLTAARDFILPAPTSVDDRIGIQITATHATAGREMSMKGDTGISIVAGGNTYTAAEWSRLFIVGEIVIFKGDIVGSQWVVERDGRIPQLGGMSLTGSDITTSSAGVYVGLNLDTVDIERGCDVDVAVAGTSVINWRRASYALISGNHTGKAGVGIGDNEFSGWAVSYGGIPGTGTTLFSVLGNHPGTLMRGRPAAGLSYVSIPAGSAIQLNQYAATTADLGARALQPSTNLSVLEILR